MTIFVDNNIGTGLNDGSSWANAFRDANGAMQSALDHANALTDEIWVNVSATPHYETVAAALTFTSTAADSETAHLNIFGVDPADDSLLGVNDAGHGGITFETTGTNSISLNVNANWHGIWLSSGGSLRLDNVGYQNSFTDCKNQSTGSGRNIQVNYSTTSQEHRNSIFDSADQFTSWRGVTRIIGGSMKAATSPMFSSFSTHGGTEFLGVDFSVNVSGKTIVAAGIYAYLDFVNCLMPASWIGVSGTFGEYLARVRFYNCDDAALYERNEIYCKSGSVKTDTGVYITTGGWSDETGSATGVPLSLVYAPNSVIDVGAAALDNEDLPITAYYDGALGSKTFTVELIDDFENALQDDEVWLDIYYYETASKVQHSIATTKVIRASDGANLAAGTGLGNWTGEPAKTTLPRSVKLVATANIQNIGVYVAVVRLAKYEANDANGDAGASLWVAPKLTIA